MQDSAGLPVQSGSLQTINLPDDYEGIEMSGRRDGPGSGIGQIESVDIARRAVLGGHQSRAEPDEQVRSETTHA
jgi:hypothetical protein